MARKVDERIGSNAELILRNYFNDKIEKAEPAKRTVLEKDLLEFNKKYISYSKNDFPKTKKFTYSMLPDFLIISELTLREFYNLLGKNIKELPADEIELIKYANNLSEEKLINVLNLVNELLPAYFFEEDIINLPPTKLSLALAKRKFGMITRGDIPDAFLRAYKDKHKGTNILIDGFPEVSEFLEVSLHYLLKMPNDTLLYANTPLSEELHDKYMLLQPYLKEKVLSTVKTLSEV